MPLISFDIQEKYYNAIRKGIKKGFWRTISEAVRYCITEQFQKERLAILVDDEKELQTDQESTD